MATQVAPRSDVDLFSDEALTDPFAIYKELRDAGPVVFMEPLGAWALTRYDDVRWAMKEWETFTSAEGIAFNELMNMSLKGTILASDPPEHTRARTVMLERLNLREVRGLRPGFRQLAGEIVGALVERARFDAVTDLAQVFPARALGELIGLSHDALDVMVHAGDASFTVVGPLNARTEAAFETVLGALEMMACLEKEDFREGSMGRAILEAADRGEIEKELGFQLVWNYTGPAFDTSIAAIGDIVWLFASHPDQWEVVRAEPDLIPAAIDECLRIESPIQLWGRYCGDGAVVDSVEIPAGERLVIGIGSANRDERHYPEPDRFDVRRRPRDHLAFGHGIHTCVGMGLARLELETLVGALAQRVERLVLDGEPVRRLNNTVRGFSSLPVSVS